MRRWWCWCLIAAGCARSGPTAAVPSAAKPDIVLKGVTLRNYRESDVYLTASTPELHLMRMSTDLKARDVSVTLASGIEITSQTVSGNANEGRLTGRDGVTFRGHDGITGRAPTATYEKNAGAQGRAHGDQGVHVEHARFAIDAQGFELDFATQHATFDRPVSHAKAGAP